MYQKTNYNNFNHQSYSGRSNNQRFRRFSGGKKQRRSKLEGVDTATFIKKASASLMGNYTPAKTFNQLNIVDQLKTNIIKKGFITPTPIQDQAIDPILKGQDLIGLANTGTGKTAAFLIPIINNIFLSRNKKALIVAPTRELAVQINEEFRLLSSGLQIYSALIMGGSNMYRQIQDLRKNPNVVIGTPGRLKDLIEQRKLYLQDFNIIVLDEVDLMVDIGFIHDVKFFISLLCKNRQSLFFSATINSKVRDILNSFVNNPITISLKQQDTSENVNQDIVRVLPNQKKIDKLHDLLIQKEFEKVLVFGQTKHGIERLFKELSFRGFHVGAIHGNKTQNQRQKTLTRFKQNEIQILLATDVASRGLDIPNVTHVINYELPECFNDYIHRIGRTGRAGKIGSALTFV